MTTDWGVVHFCLQSCIIIMSGIEQFRISFYTFQVASRVQKYFIKLTKAGIPVPGRTPNLCMYTKKVFIKGSNNTPFVILCYLYVE